MGDKQFSIHLWRLLRRQPREQLTFSKLPAAYEDMYKRPFFAKTYYGRTLEEFIDVIHDHCQFLTCTRSGNDMVLAIPKPKRTDIHIARTHEFANECCRLLSRTSRCRLPLKDFIPAYHQFFGWQCR